MRVGLAGAFKFIVEHGDTGIIKYESPWYKNLITDHGLNRLGYGWGAIRVAVGSGVATPTYASSALTNWLGTSSSTGSYSSYGLREAENHAYYRLAFTFNIGQIQGTISEIGLTGNYTTIPTYLYTYSALQDANGTPTTLTLGEIDRLTVIYEIRQYWPTSDLAFIATLNGIERSCISRVASYSGWVPNTTSAAGVLYEVIAGQRIYYPGVLGAAGAQPTGPFSNANRTVADYVDGSLQRENTVTWATGSGTLAGMNIFKSRMPSVSNGYSIGGEWQISFDPPIDKTNLENFSLTVRLHWGRYAP